jgi:hypothetical protein
MVGVPELCLDEDLLTLDNSFIKKLLQGLKLREINGRKNNKQTCPISASFP